MSETTETPMISAKAANMLYREKERYKDALDLIAASGVGQCADWARQTLRAEKSWAALNGKKP